MRLDRLLWHLRYAPSRNQAQQWVLAGHIRINGKRAVKPSTSVAPGDVLTLPLRNTVRIIEVLALPQRRGPAFETQSCYRVLDETAANPIAAGEINSPEGTMLP
jgi:ribosome-associated heat shock protein Hsp15